MDIKLPALGEGADSGTVVNLFVKEGDRITEDQPILELENEKAVATIPSTAAGTVGKIYVKTGDKISVGQRILALSEGGGAASAKPSKTEPAPKAKVKAPAPRPEEAAEEPTEEPEQEEVEPQAKPGIGPAAAPSIRKLARDLGIDLARIRGSARGGRIVLKDVRAYIQKLQRLASQPRGAAAPTSEAAPKPAPEQIDFSKWGPVSKKPL